MYQDRILGRIFLGAIILFLGIGFLLDAFGVLPFSSLISEWWPVLIIVFGLFRLLSPSTKNHTISLVIIIIGFLLLLWQLGYIVLNIWSLIGPIILILIGIALLRGHHPSQVSPSHNATDAFALFSSSVKKVDNSSYEGGNAVSLFGAVKLDLRKAIIANTVTVNATAIFGGIDIIVPETCQVQVLGTPIFGSIEDNTEQVKSSKCTVIIKGEAIFGGISIKN